MLLGAVTALLVARPLCAGEDPGRLHSPEAISGVVLNLLWLVTALAGAVWLARSRRPLRLGGWVPFGLWLTTGLIALSTIVVRCYKHPGWLITWEWATVAIIFLLVRALTADADPATDSGGGLLSAFGATVASLAAFGLYQLASGAAKTETAAKTILLPDVDFLAPLKSRWPGPEWICRATYSRGDTFFATLLLSCLLFFIAATQRNWRGIRTRLAKPLLGMVTVMLVAGALQFEREANQLDLSGRMQTSWQIFLQHWVLGVGQGNFDRHLPGIQDDKVRELVTDGGSAYLDLLANSGSVTLLTLGVTLVVVFVQSLRGLRKQFHYEQHFRQAASGPRWEYYFGGVAGLFIGFVLHVLNVPTSTLSMTILQLGVEAAGRAVVWFAVFALLDETWTVAARRFVAFFGVALVIWFGSMSLAPLLPAILQPLILLAAIAVAQPTTEPVARRSPARWVPAGIMLAVVFANLFLVCEPVCRSAKGMADARRAERQYPRVFARAEAAEPGPEKTRESAFLKHYLIDSILNRLNDAWHADPWDNAPALEWVAWYHQYWKLYPEFPTEQGLGVTKLLAERDPSGTQPLIAELQLRLTYARLDKRQFTPKPGRPVDPVKLERDLQEWRGEHLRESEALIRRIVALDPALEARLRFRFAQTLLSLADASRRQQGEEETRRVWELEEKAIGPRWHLDREQRWLVRRWLKLPLEGGERQYWVALPIDPGGVSWALVPLVPPK